MKIKVFGIGVAVVLMSVATSCVPLKQFEEASARTQELEKEAAYLRDENDELSVRNRELSTGLERLQKQIADLEKEQAELERQVKEKEYQYDDLLKKYNDALEQLGKGSPDSDSRQLLAHLQQLQEDLQKREDALMDSEQELKDKQKRLQAALGDLETAKSQMDAQNERLAMLEQALKQKEEAMLQLRQRVSDALTGFSGDELKVHMKNGKVYVSLEEKLLFKSGSYEVNAQGASALKKLAVILEQNTDVDVVVEGHTDKVPYKSGVLKDNWDLSVKRATSVVRILLSGSNIDPKRVSAAGKGEFLPVVDGDSPQAYQKNRRTEIILTPRLDKILNLLGGH